MAKQSVTVAAAEARFIRSTDKQCVYFIEDDNLAMVRFSPDGKAQWVMRIAPDVLSDILMSELDKFPDWDIRVIDPHLPDFEEVDRTPVRRLKTAVRRQVIRLLAAAGLAKRPDKRGTPCEK